uniref:CSON003030 protein n=1 Tax=Culicoides sonorensis TaxID=179676 RepID=A0A336MP87_CULSO
MNGHVNKAMVPDESPETVSQAETVSQTKVIKQQDELNSELDYSKPKISLIKKVSTKLKQTNPFQCVLSMFPVLQWLPKYSFKNDLPGDLISGMTIAVMHIPQGIGYALLGQVPPIVGIYMAFFPVLAYFIFGTSRHNSMGTFAVISLMVGKSVLRLSTPVDHHTSNSTDLFVPNGDIETYDPVQVATALCFVVGMIQFVMYLLQLGVASALLSETLVSGFTTGAAIQVLTSQIKDLLGIKIIPVTTYFEVILTYKQIFSKIATFNNVAVIISAVSITILILNNEVLKPYLSKKTTIPVPIELIVVIIGTTLSTFLDFKDNYQVSTIGHIPTGFPEPEVPQFSLMRELLIDGFIIAIVSYTCSVSMGLILAQKHDYEINFNQELLAMGASNIFGSFFACMPFSASLSRSYIQLTTGGKTQIASVVSCGILAVVLLWVAPVFESLPRACIASIIVVALKGLLWQAKQFFGFWKLSKLDAMLWLGTFLTVVIVGIDIGLLVGVLLSISCIFFKGMKPYSCILGKVPDTDLYLDTSRYPTAQEIDGIKIFHFCGCLNFCSRAIFKSELTEKVKTDAVKDVKESKSFSMEVSRNPLLQFLVLDFSALSYIDSSGVSFLKTLVNDYNKQSISVFIGGSSCPVYEMMMKCGIAEMKSDKFKLFATVHDAVTYALDQMIPIVKTDSMCYL